MHKQRMKMISVLEERYFTIFEFWLYITYYCKRVIMYQKVWILNASGFLLYIFFENYDYMYIYIVNFRNVYNI